MVGEGDQLHAVIKLQIQINIQNTSFADTINKSRKEIFDEIKFSIVSLKNDYTRPHNFLA